jgi:FkbM family methyltransferase
MLYSEAAQAPRLGDETLAALSENPSTYAQRASNALRRLLELNRNRAVVYGAGNLGTRSIACLRSIGIEPLALADGAPDKWGTEVAGLRVLSPSEAAARYGKDCVFIVAVWNARSRFAQTRAGLASLGCAAVSSPAEVCWAFPETFTPFFSFDLPHHVVAAKTEVLAAANLWADTASIREYEGHIRWRLLGDFAAIPAPVDEPQYFTHLTPLSSAETFVDCGAYDGDTLQAFLSKTEGRFERILAIEPAPQTFAQLTSLLRRLPADVAQRITVKQVAAGTGSEDVALSAVDGTGARVLEAGTAGAVFVKQESIDRLCDGLNPTYLKMDIEGAELDALASAAATIARSRPSLAICVYHHQSDIWRVPLAIDAMAPGYRFFLRSHECDGWETVCYAVPEERVSAAVLKRA